MRRSWLKNILWMLVSSVATTQLWADAPDATLLSLVPAAAHIVGGMTAPPSVEGPAWFLLMTHANTLDMNDFTSLIGVDDSRLLQQLVLVTSEGRQGGLEHSLLAKGHFDRNRIFKAAAQNGALFKKYKGISVAVVPPFDRDDAFKCERWLTFIDTNLALFGTMENVQEEVDRLMTHASIDPALLKRLGHMRRNNDLWCVVITSTYSAEIAKALSSLDHEIAAAVSNHDEFEFGFHYGRKVELEYEVNTASNSTREETLLTPALRSLDEMSIGRSSVLSEQVLDQRPQLVHGVVRMTTSRYESWTAELQGQTSGHAVSRLPRH